jgi:acyl dehydratase
MNRQPFYEDVSEGDDITPLAKQPTTAQLVMWVGASGDYNPIHYDKDYALGHGLPGIIVPGQLSGCFLGQMLTDWMGDRGRLKKFSLSYKGMNFPGEALSCKGTVTRKYIEGGQHLLSIKIWVEKPGGERTLTGTAIIELPTRD